MNQIANTLISALRSSLWNQTAIEQDSVATPPMRQLSADELRGVIGGDDSTGPRGGWIAMASVAI